ncbi:MAG TPA: exopolyphosphatase, partial [Planctomycetaceae bacterium]|nr:exopolyphosphatase [Planctomycetaceae bacterium]
EINTAAALETSFLEEFTDHILSMSRDEIARKYHLSFPEAETVGPALLIYVLLARAFELDHVKVTNTNLRDGLLQELAATDVWIEELRNQIVRSAIDLGQRYDFDESHARHVADLSSSLFWQLRSEHQLDPAYEMLLHVAALLHEIGGYISHRSLHKHSMYLIRHSELFGLGQRQLLLVALIARYHRRASPQQQHDAYSNLPRSDRVAVAKLAAIVRIAIAMDDSRSQWIKQVDCKLVKDRLVLNIHNTEDISIEQIAVRQSASLFEEIYGKRVELRQARS